MGISLWLNALLMLAEIILNVALCLYLRRKNPILKAYNQIANGFAQITPIAKEFRVCAFNVVDIAFQLPPIIVLYLAGIAKCPREMLMHEVEKDYCETFMAINLLLGRNKYSKDFVFKFNSLFVRNGADVAVFLLMPGRKAETQANTNEQLKSLTTEKPANSVANSEQTKKCAENERGASESRHQVASNLDLDKIDKAMEFMRSYSNLPKV